MKFLKEYLKKRINQFKIYNQDFADFKEAGSLLSEQAELFNIHANNKSEAAPKMQDFYSQIPLEDVSMFGK